MSQNSSLEEQVLEFQSPVYMPEFERSPFQVNVLRKDGKCIVYPQGLEERGRHLYFLGYQAIGNGEPGRFYMLHGSRPLPTNGSRPQLDAQDLGLDVGFEDRLESLPITRINYNYSKADNIMVFYDKRFNQGGHKGSLELSGERLKIPTRATLIYNANPGQLSLGAKETVFTRYRNLIELSRGLK